MKNLITRLRTFGRSNEGQDLLEYALARRADRARGHRGRRADRHAREGYFQQHRVEARSALVNDDWKTAHLW